MEFDWVTAGAPQATFRPAARALRSARVRARLYAAAGILIIIAALVLTIRSGERGTLVVLGGFGLVLVALGVHSHLTEWKPLTHKQVDVYESGLVYRDGKGEAHPYGWNQLQELTLAESMRSSSGRRFASRVWIVTPEADKPIAFAPSEWDEFGELLRILRRGVELARLDGMTLALRNGETVRFGAYGVSLEGIHTRAGIQPWSAINAVRLDDSYPARIYFKTGDGWRPWVTIANFPNYHLFLRLLAVVGKPLEHNQ